MKNQLSALDLSPVVSDSTVGEALRNSIQLGKSLESLGYSRIWVAEHHGMPGVASAATAVLIGQIAAATSRIRVGSGGIMLPNHAPLTIAEQFGTLDALFPDRIDLGIGRAPGSDPITSHALRRTRDGNGADEFPSDLAELFAFMRGSFQDNHPYSRIHATPGEGANPEVWLLGSSLFSAQLSARWGLPFSFARHFAPKLTVPAFREYRENFQPGILSDPHAMVAVTVSAAETHEEAERRLAPHKLMMARLRTGNPGRIPTYAEAETNPLTPMQEAAVQEASGAWLVGTREEVADGFRNLLNITEADEVMITAPASNLDDRINSHEIAMQAWNDVHAERSATVG